MTEPRPSVGAPPGVAGPDGPLLRIIKDRRVAFVIVGGVNTIVGFGWFTLFMFLLERWIGYMGVLVLAQVVSVLCAFVLYRRFVFHVRGHVIRDLLRFSMVYVVAFAVNAVLLPLLVEVAHMPVLLAQALIVFVTTVVSYLGHRYFSFARKEDA